MVFVGGAVAELLSHKNITEGVESTKNMINLMQKISETNWVFLQFA
ncbi:MAG: hypothetical protein ACI85I_001794, partial [Arenicella sp.]